MYFAIITFSHIFLGSFFYKNMVVIYVFLLEETMYSYCCLCILIVSLCILIASLCILIVSLCILIVSLCILIVSLCILTVVYVLLDAATLTEVFSVLFPQL